MTDYPLSTLAAQVTATGISAPAYADVLASLQASFTSIYGSDVVLDNSTQDGQWLAIIAQAISDANAMAIATYNAFSPATAQGAGLSSVVKINGLTRELPSNSTADITLIGQAGTPIVNGLIEDAFKYQWALPPLVQIPSGGSIVITATCTTPGAITAAEGTITDIVNPTAGWQSATNASAATVGQPVESDATLRKRQSVSTALPALSILDAIIGQIANLPGVEAWAAYENDTGTPDENGVPGHSIALVVEGGDATAIANTIALIKTPGTGTYGTTTETVIDPKGVPNTINFFRPTLERIVVSVTGTALAGYVDTTAPAIAQALSTFVSALAFGADVPWDQLWVPAKLNNGALSSTYKITAITLCVYGGTLEPADVVIAFNQGATLAVADVTVSIS